MTNFSKQKGNKGHQLTEELLQSIGWSTYTAPHVDISFRDVDPYGRPYFRKTGCNDIYAVSKIDEPTKKEGGFDIIANKTYTVLDEIIGLEKDVSVSSFWQVKKTKSDPFNMNWKSNRDLRAKTLRSCDEHGLPREWCFISHWPDGVGLTRGKPRIWRCDDKFFEPTAEELKIILEVS